MPEGTPAGRYTLWAGLWRARGNQRMAAHGDVPIDANRAEVATIEVIP